MEKITKKQYHMTEMKPMVMDKLVQLIQQISFGEIVITIHDSKVVQVEKREKTRFHD